MQTQTPVRHQSKVFCLTTAALFAALTAVGAFLKIPLGTMSLTLQFLFTAMAGVLLGAKWGAISKFVYVAIGLVGIPVFTMGGGLGYVFQPSFGFLLGLIPAAFVIGFLSNRWSGILGVAISCIVGLAVLYLFGLPYMWAMCNYLGIEMSVATAFKSGMLIYLPGDFIKIAVTVLVTPPIKKAIKSMG